MKYWLMKTEPDEFSIDDLKSAKNKTTAWEGVRNFQARNFMRDEMKIGDQVLIYHSSCKTIGVAGVAEVVKDAHPDPSALDPQSPYFDPKASHDEPRWYMVAVKWKKSFEEVLSLKKMKKLKALEKMQVLKKGNRLSITPVSKVEFQTIIKLGSK